ncbi:MAG TPA: ATP-binding protein [Candidatus Saccharimonadales bacterium]|nr:ATP-binding protein [Candidatus Saccharimonadales bacterium]
MKSPEYQPEPTPEIIQGVKAEINIAEPDVLRDYLEKDYGYVDLYEGRAKDLPSPLTHASLQYARDEDTGIMHMEAVTNFNPTAVEQNGARIAWQTVFNTVMQEKLNDSDQEIADTPAHEQHTIYIPINTEYVARIEPVTELDYCSVGLSLHQLSKLEKQLGKRVPVDAYSATNQPYEVLVDFSKIWSHVIDSIAENYSQANKDNPEIPPVITVAAPAFRTAPERLQEMVAVENRLPSREIIDPTKVRFEDIAGYDNIKEQLLDLALLNQHPQMAADIELDSINGILLHGVPGTAKTKLLKAFANEIDAPLREIRVSEIIEKWVGNSARNLDEYFKELIKEPGFIVVLMDEFDSIAASNKHNHSSERIDVVNRLKEWVITIGEKHHNIILTAATNKIDDVSEDLIRPGRFLAIEVPAPNEYMRRDIWMLMIGKAAVKADMLAMDNPEAVGLPVDQASIDYNELAAKTEGMVGAHFTEILNAIRKQRLRTYIRSNSQEKTMEPITQTDLLKQIKAVDLRD